MKKFSDGMKEDSDRIYKYSLINLAIAFLPPEVIESVEFSGFTLSSSGLNILQTITAIIVVVQTVSFLASLFTGRSAVIAESSRVLTDIEKGEITIAKNIHTGKNYYERTYIAMEWLRAAIFLTQTALPVLICALCMYFTFAHA